MTSLNEDAAVRRLTRRGSAAVLVAACAVAGAGVVLYGVVADLVEGSRGVGHAHEILAALQDVSSRVREAEHAQKAFILTGEARHLAAYHAAVARVPDDLAALRRLTVDDPAQKPRLDRLETAVGRRLEAAAELSEAYHRSGLSAVQDRLRAEPGGGSADEIAAAAGDVQAEMRRRLEQRHRANESLARTAVGVGGACLAGCVGGFALAFVLLGREVSLRRRVEASLQETNLRLEGSVQDLEERTADANALAALDDYLQSCRSAAEGYAILARALPHLLPGVAGAVGIVGRSRDAVEMVASWGDGSEPFAPHFHLDECWGVRQGRPHHAADGWDPVCRHLGPHDGGRLCLPMAVQGEMLGVLSLGTRRAGGLTERERRAARSIAEQAALSLANLRLQEALRDKSRRDALTGLFNRRFLDETLEREFARARREGRPVAVVMTDVDHFKRFNDVYGHEAGDAVLAAVAGVLSSSVRGEDVACRYGGEEFCLVMPGADVETARRRAEEIREAVAGLEVSYGPRPVGPVTLSAGVAAFPARDEESVVTAADAALYRAKRGGRNRVAVDADDIEDALAVEETAPAEFAAV